MNQATPSFAARLSRLGIVAPVRQQKCDAGRDGSREIIDANGASLLQVDPLGTRGDGEVSQIAELVVEAINAHARAQNVALVNTLAELMRDDPDLTREQAVTLIRQAEAEAAQGGL